MDGGDAPFVAVDPMDIYPSPPPSRPGRFKPKLKAAERKPKPSSDPQDPTPTIRQGAAEESVAAVISAENAAIAEEEEDPVVREIDVFYRPLEGHSQLYVMQYPLRPSWRPYGLDERCEEVKVDPKCSKVELVLRLNVDSENYDERVPGPMRIEKQRLLSSSSISTEILVAGTLKENQLHLNPVHGVLQFRPSMDHLNDHSVQKGKLKVQEVGNNLEKPWVSLQYNKKVSSLSRRYKEKMLAKEDNHIDFTMNRYEYLNSLCGAPSTVKGTSKVSLTSFEPSLPLEERLREWFRRGCQVNSFDALRHLDSSMPEEDILKMLDSHAFLVQGLWVAKSSLICEGHNANVRDYILFLFSQSQAVKASELNKLASDGDLKRFLKPLAYERSTLKDWKFKEERDTSFMKGHAQIVKAQAAAWSMRRKELEEYFTRRTAKPRAPGRTAKRNRDTVTSNRSEGSGRGSSVAVSMSAENRESISKALQQIFSNKNARSIISVRRELCELAIYTSTRAKEDSKTKALVSAITASNSTPELLESVLQEVAFQVHNVYVLRSGSNPALDPFREVVVRLFCGKEPNAELKKQEIVEAVKNSLGRDISNSEYDQVVRDLCAHRGEGLALKTSDKLQ